MYKLHISSTAQKQIKKLSDVHRISIMQNLQEIKEEPFFGKALSRDLTRRFSYRVGVYRIIYAINEKDKVVSIFTIFPS